MRIEPISPDLQPARLHFQKPVTPPPAGTPSFKDTFTNFLNDVNELQKTAGDLQKKFVAGEINDVHQVRIASNEADTGFNMLMELRNKAIDGLQEAMRIRL